MGPSNNYDITDVNKAPKYNLLNVILRPTNHAENTNSYSYPILYGCMNTHRGGEKFSNFIILLYSGSIFGPAVCKRGNLVPCSVPVARVHPQTADHR